MRQLSIPMPVRAESTCSTVWMRAFPTARLVERVVSATCSERAGGDLDAEVHAHEPDAAVGGGGRKRERHGTARVKAHPPRFAGSSSHVSMPPKSHRPASRVSDRRH